MSKKRERPRKLLVNRTKTCFRLLANTKRRSTDTRSIENVDPSIKSVSLPQFTCNLHDDAKMNDKPDENFLRVRRSILIVLITHNC